MTGLCNTSAIFSRLTRSQPSEVSSFGPPRFKSAATRHLRVRCKSWRSEPESRDGKNKHLHSTARTSLNTSIRFRSRLVRSSISNPSLDPDTTNGRNHIGDGKRAARKGSSPYPSKARPPCGTHAMLISGDSNRLLPATVSLRLQFCRRVGTTLDPRSPRVRSELEAGWGLLISRSARPHTCETVGYLRRRQARRYPAYRRDERPSGSLQRGNPKTIRSIETARSSSEPRVESAEADNSRIPRYPSGRCRSLHRRPRCHSRRSSESCGSRH